MSRMRIGSIVYATTQGLGILAKSFWDAGVLTDVLVLEHSRTNHWDWYPGQDRIKIRDIYSPRVLDFLTSLDVALFFETPFYWQLIPHCRAAGVRTAIMPMHECMPKEILTSQTPNLWLCPSLLDSLAFPPEVHVDSVYLPVPVAGVPWRLRERAEVFVHNAGHGGLLGRNGTQQIFDAMRHVSSPVKVIVRTQERIRTNCPDRRLEIRTGEVPYEDLYREGDVFLFPERFNGLSLPLQEARASGMLVMATDRFPNNQWLPREPLIPTIGSLRSRVAERCRSFDESIITPQDIADTIDRWYGADLREYSLGGKEWAESMGWDRWKASYIEVLTNGRERRAG